MYAQRCRRLRILQLGPAPGQGPGPDPDLTPGLTLEAAPAHDPESVAIGESYHACLFFNMNLKFESISKNQIFFF